MAGCRHFFLDAALLMDGHPQEHLLETWEGILQQDEEEDGEQRPSTPAHLRHRAEALWSACEGAALLSCELFQFNLYSRWELASGNLPPAAAAAHAHSWVGSYHFALNVEVPMVMYCRVRAHDCIVEMAEAVHKQSSTLQDGR